MCGSHGFCDNTDGSFRCLCDQGFETSSSGWDCVGKKPAASQARGQGREGPWALGPISTDLGCPRESPWALLLKCLRSHGSIIGCHKVGKER